MAPFVSRVMYPRATLSEIEWRAFTSRGGQLTFLLPSTWETYPNNNGAMYCPPDGPGALYLDVLTYRVRTDSEADDRLRSAASKAGFEIVTTEGGQEYGRRTRTYIEDGEEVVSIGWLLSFSEPGILLLAVFSYCVETKFLEGSAMDDFLRRLEREVLASRARL